MTGPAPAARTAVARLERARRLSTAVGRIYLQLKATQLVAGGWARLADGWPRAVPGPPRRFAEQRRGAWRRFHRDSAETLYDTAIEMQGLVLKGCQYLGARADLVPDAWTRVLARLQDRVPPREPWVVRRVIEDELGRPLERLFRSFAPRPVASASLAQVHEAVLHDGRRVAVKVQYPEVAALVRSDLANLRALLRAIGWLERDLDLVPIVDELGRHVPRELDFLAEARHAERMAALFAGRDDVSVPAVHRALSSRRVLVMDYVDGVRITDAAALEAAGIDREAVVATLVEAWCEQVLVHGFFQADPHPGNLLVGTRGPHRGRLVLLDFGLARELPPRFRHDLLGFAMALLRRDPEAIADALATLGFATRDGGRDALVALARAALAILRELAEAGSLSPAHMARVGAELAETLRRHPLVRVPGHVVLLGRTLGLLSGVARTLRTRVDPLRIVLPYVIGSAPPAPAAPRGRR